ncbi:hypothetical protein POVCU2_0026270 [Plasmodium ovale curtisi]|uniref:Uncharacterized protein n=1 Tax=Plasmodium ovale curtisi TaxID=864141 RepID=A0A1A8X8Q2_PLAOA|nr:hypothetical protein POVCU2_0026270 [Plasmodium ovale curtisi]SBT00199.1 hypothetical protein POVCU1_058330 [Plasmodium ovale curtisi]
MVHTPQWTVAGNKEKKFSCLQNAMRPHIGLARIFGVKKRPCKNVAKLKHGRRDSSDTTTPYSRSTAYHRCCNCSVECNSKGKPHLSLCLFTFHFLTTYE